MMRTIRLFKAAIVAVFVLLIMGISVSLAQSSNPPQVYSILWSKDGSRFAVVTRESLTIYDSSFNVVVSQEFPGDIAFDVPRIAFSPDGERLYVGRRSYPSIVNTANLEQLCAANWSAVICTYQAIVDSTTLSLLVDLSDIIENPYTTQWSNDGQAIAFRREDDRATNIYSAIDGALLQSFSAPLQIWAGASEGGIVWSPNNLYFAKALVNHASVMSASTGELVYQYQFDTKWIYALHWSPDSTQIAMLTEDDVESNSTASFSNASSPTGASRNSLIIFDVATGQVRLTIYVPHYGIPDVEWSPDGTQIAVSIGYPRVYIWDTSTGSLIDSYQVPPYAIQHITYSPYGGRLMIGFRELEMPSHIYFDLIPMSTYVQSELGGRIQFVAPAASPERLSTILSNCVTDASAARAGSVLIEAQQYAEFTDWVTQQPAAVIPSVCAADLQTMTQVIMSKLPTANIITTP